MEPGFAGGFGLRLNPLLLHLPLGTLAANLAGGYLIGLAVAVFYRPPRLAARAAAVPHYRLSWRSHHLSTFSAEVVQMFQAAQYGWAMLTAAVHLGGSLAMTGLGFWTVSRLQGG